MLRLVGGLTLDTKVFKHRKTRTKPHITLEIFPRMKSGRC
jgi:hypothetical protein